MYVEKDKHLLTLFRIAPERAFREMFDVYYMQLCVYVVQLTDSFDMAEDVVQELSAKWAFRFSLRAWGWVPARISCLRSSQADMSGSLTEL